MRAMIIAVLFAVNALALAQDTDAELEARAKTVGQSLRCVVCQNESIEESQASLAKDMRRLVRARIKAGDSNAEVMAFMRERYGDYVLLKPPVQSNTYALWFGPFLLVLMGGIWFVMSARRKADVDVAALSDAERAKLSALLKDEGAP